MSSYLVDDLASFPILNSNNNVVDYILPAHPAFRDEIVLPGFVGDSSFNARIKKIKNKFIKIRQPKQKRVYIDPKFKFSARERYAHYLKKYYAYNPFKFQDVFRRFLPNTTFYNDIFLEIKEQFLQQPKVKNLIKAEKRRLKRLEINKIKFNYNCLEIEPCGEEWEDPVINSLVPYKPPVKVKVISDDEIIDNFFEIESPIFVTETRRDRFRTKFNRSPLRKGLEGLLKQKIYKINNNNKYINRSSYVLRKNKNYSINYLYPRVNIVSSSNDVVRWAKNKYPNLYNKNFVKPQMENSDAHGTGDGDIVCKQMGNVVLDNQRGYSKAKTKITTKKKISKLSSNDPIIDSKTLSDRFIVLDTFPWTKQHEVGSVIKSYSLPAYLLQSRRTSPNAMPLNMSTFSNCDIEIEVLVNSNKFQMGQLMVAWLYDPNADLNINQRINLQTLSQTHHILLNAGASNSGIMSIKFIHPLSSLPNFASNELPESLNLGKLYFLTMNKLSVVEGVSDECHVTWGLRLINRNFYGMRDIKVGDFVYPQMEAAAAVVAVEAAEALLHGRGNDPNRDNPPYTGARAPMVPQSNNSFCIGDNATAPINSLRLDAMGQHVHNHSGEDEMSISHVSKIMGFVDTMTWDADKTSGYLLKSFDASPMWDPKEYVKTTVQTDTAYRLPPVAVLSSMFAYWSGELQLRLDIVKAFSHTGRLLVCYVPFYLKDISLTQAYSYPHSIFDVQEQNTFTFTIPYISYMPMYPRRMGFTSTTDKTNPPGRVHIFILNALRKSDNVPNNVQINYYFGAGDSFEVFVPAQPSISTAFFTRNDKPSTTVNADNPPWYFGNDNAFVDNDGVDFAICRSSIWAGRVETFKNTDPRRYYRMDAASRNLNDKIKVKFGYTTYTTYSIADLWYVPVDVDDGYGAVYFAACATEEDAKSYFTEGPQGAGRKHCLRIENTTSSDYCSGNPSFDSYPAPTNDDFVILPQMEERVVGSADDEIYGSCSVYPAKEMINSSFFGEKFTSLKTLCRRYQPYGVAKISPTSTLGDAICSIPIVPQGLDVQVNSKNSQFGRYLRDGVIPLVLSGYRYYSGGLRLAMLSSSEKFTVWCQHRPDYEAPMSIQCNLSGKSADSLINTGYAMYLQSMKVNNVVNVEIPYYKNRNYVYLQRPNLNRKDISGALHLGQLLVGIEGAARTDNMTMSLFYALADDSRAVCFQGFPPMLVLDEFQSPISYHSSKVNSLLLNSPVPDPSCAFHQMNFNINDGQPVVLEIGDRAHSALEGFTKALSGVQPKIENLKGDVLQGVMSFISQLGHVLITPSKAHILWALVSIFSGYGIINITNLSKFMEKTSAVVDCIPDLPSGGSHEPLATGSSAGSSGTPIYEAASKWMSENGDVFHQGPIDPGTTEAAVLDFVTMLFTTASLLMSLSTLPPKPRGLFKIAADIITAISNVAKSQKAVMEFFKTIIRTIKRILEMTLWKEKANKGLEIMMEQEMPMICDWYAEVKKLTDVKNDEKVKNLDSVYAADVEECYTLGVTIGHYMLKHAQLNPDARNNFSAVYNMYREAFLDLQRKRNDMHARGCDSLTRREPFCIWFSGSPGCGKSTMAQRMIPRLLKSMGVSYQGSSTFVVPPMSQYWSNCKAQPCAYMDDFLAVDGGQMKEDMLASFFAINSPTIFNPNMAALEEKNLIYAPELFVVCANSSFPQPTGVNKEAFFRRRNALIECEFIPEIVKAGIKNISLPVNRQKADSILLAQGKSVSNFDHLCFYLYDDAMYESSPKSEPLTYEELVALLEKQSHDYRSHQLSLQKAAQDELDSVCVTNIEDTHENLSSLRKEVKRTARFLIDNKPLLDRITPKKFFEIAHKYGQTGYISKEDMSCFVETRKLLQDHVVDNLEECNEILALYRKSLDKKKNDVKPQCFICPEDNILTNCFNNYITHPTENLILKSSKALDRLLIILEISLTGESLNLDDELQLSTSCDEILGQFVNNIVELDYSNISFKTDIDNYSKVFNLSQVKSFLKLQADMTDKGKKVTPCLGFKCFLRINTLTNSRITLTFKRKEVLSTEFGETKMRYKSYLVAIGNYCIHGNEKFCDYKSCYGKCLPAVCKQSFCCCYNINVLSDYYHSTKTFLIQLKDGNFFKAPRDGCGHKECFFISGGILKQREAFFQKWIKPRVKEFVKLRDIDMLDDWFDKYLPVKVKDEATPENFSKKIKAYWSQIRAKSLFSYKNYMSPFLFSVYEFIKALMPFLLTTGILAFLIWKFFGDKWYGASIVSGIGKGVSKETACRIYTVTTSEVDHQLVSSGDNLRSKSGKAFKPVFNKIAKIQSGEFNDNMKHLFKKVCDNSYFIISPQGKKYRIVFLYENVAILLKHYYEDFSHKIDQHGWKLRGIKSDRSIDISPSSWKPSFTESSSMGFVRINEAHFHKSLINSVLTEKGHTLPKGECYIFSPNEEYSHIVRVFPKHHYGLKVNGEGYIKEQHLKSVYSYDWTNPGNCGSILVDPTQAQPIMGVHVAGGKILGYAEPIAYEQFDAWRLNDMESHDNDIVFAEEQPSKRLDGDFVYVGKLHETLVHHESGKTRERPSLVAGEIWPVITEPAPLGLGDPRMPPDYSPLFAGVNNMLHPPKPFPQNIVDEAADCFSDRFITLCQPTLCPVVRREIEEVVVGIPGVKYFDGLEMSSSEGYPFVHYRPPGACDKRWLFELEGNPQTMVRMHRFLYEMIVRELNMRKNGIRPTTYFIDCLKDARLAKTKVTTEGKTRIFSISPVQFTIAFRMYFQDFLVAFKTNRLNLCHAVGIAPDGPEWGRLVSFMSQPFRKDTVRDGRIFFSGDYKNFGPTLSKQILVKVKEIILRWCKVYYEDCPDVDCFNECMRIRSILLDEIIDAYHIVHGDVYKPLCGAPSGSPVTTELNCMVNELYMLIAFKMMTKQSSDSFYRNVRLCTYGDDVIAAVSKDFKFAFNNETLANFFSKFNIGYTDASKISNQSYDSLLDLTFLKRQFKHHPIHPHEFLAPLDLQYSVQETVNWASHKIEKKEGTYLSMEACLANAYTHGEKIYNQIKEQIVLAAVKHSIPTVFRSWSEWDKIHFETYYPSEFDRLLNKEQSYADIPT